MRDDDHAAATSAIATDSREIQSLMTVWHFLQGNGDVSIPVLRSALSPRAQQVFDHAYVHRLRHISHLGILYKVRPDIKWCSRLVHSVSVAVLARATGLILAQQHGTIREEVVTCLEVAGLLHDVGHGPFSHFYDQFAHTHGLTHVPSHEERGVAITNIVLEEVWPRTRAQGVEKALIQHFIHPDVRRDYSKVAVEWLARHGLIGLGDIVANKIHGFDVDRFDYLGRDACLAGHLDKAVRAWSVVPKIIMGSKLDDGGHTWVFPPWATSFVDDLRELRKWMFSHVYWAEKPLKRRRRGVRRSCVGTYLDMFPMVHAEPVSDHAHDVNPFETSIIGEGGNSTSKDGSGEASCTSASSSGSLGPLGPLGSLRSPGSVSSVGAFDIHRFVHLTEKDFEAYLSMYEFAS